MRWNPPKLVTGSSRATRIRGHRMTASTAAKSGIVTGLGKKEADFMLRVLAWPINGIGYVNLHYSMVNSRGGKDIITGKPYQDIDQLLSYCTSLQSQTGINSRGGVKAVRLAFGINGNSAASIAMTASRFLGMGAGTGDCC